MKTGVSGLILSSTAAFRPFQVWCKHLTSLLSLILYKNKNFVDRPALSFNNNEYQIKNLIFPLKEIEIYGMTAASTISGWE